MKLEALRAAASGGLPGAPEPEKPPQTQVDFLGILDVSLPPHLEPLVPLLHREAMSDARVEADGRIIAVDLALPGSSDSSIAIALRVTGDGYIIVDDMIDKLPSGLVERLRAAPRTIHVSSGRRIRTKSERELSRDIVEAYAKLARDMKVGKLDMYGMALPEWMPEWALALHKTAAEEVDEAMKRAVEAAMLSKAKLSKMTSEAMSAAFHHEAIEHRARLDVDTRYERLVAAEERAKWPPPEVHPGGYLIDTGERPWKPGRLKREFRRRRHSEPLLPKLARSSRSE